MTKMSAVAGLFLKVQITRPAVKMCESAIRDNLIFFKVCPVNCVNQAQHTLSFFLETGKIFDCLDRNRHLPPVRSKRRIRYLEPVSNTLAQCADHPCGPGDSALGRILSTEAETNDSYLNREKR